MSEFISILTHARRLKAAVDELTLEQLQEVSAKLEKIIEDRVSNEEETRRAEAEKLAKIEKYKQMLAEDGISVSEIAGAVSAAAPKAGKRAPKPPKYEVFANGERVTWTGQGRMPNAIKVRVDAGDKLESFLIKE